MRLLIVLSFIDEIMLESFDKILAQRRYDGFQFFEDPLMQFSVLFPVFFDTVKYLRFQVSNDEPFKELEKSPFYNFNPVKPFCVFFEFAEKIGDCHLVGLFVEFFQLHRPYFVVPPLHGCGIKNFQDECFPDHTKYPILSPSLGLKSMARLDNIAECLAYQYIYAKEKLLNHEKE